MVVIYTNHAGIVMCFVFGFAMSAPILAVKLWHESVVHVSDIVRCIPQIVHAVSVVVQYWYSINVSE